MAKASVVLEMTGDEKRIVRALARSEREVDKLKKSLRNTGQVAKETGKKTEDAFGGKSLSSLTSYAARVVSLGAVIAGLSAKYRSWIKNIRDISSEAQKASNELIAFAALQEGGTKAERVRQASRLAASFGVTNRGEAFNTVQALQSARGGDFQAGLDAARTAFAATRVGIPLEFGRELEVLGASQGQAPGQALRRAFVAGQLSARDPETLARASAGISFFEDKEFGFAAAGVIAGSVRAEQLQTFTKAAGIGLSRASAEGFQKTFKKLGVGAGATQLDRLRALAGAGINTQEKLKLAGLGEIRQQQAIAALVQNLADVERIRTELPLRATPGLFARQRGGVVAEVPSVGLTQKITELRVTTKDVKAFGKQALPSLREDVLAQVRGLAIREAGLTSGAFGVPFLDEEERATRLAFARAQIYNTAGTLLTAGNYFPLEDRYQAILQRFGISQGGGLEEVAGLLREIRDRMGGGGEALVPAGEDR